MLAYTNDTIHWFNHKAGINYTTIETRMNEYLYECTPLRFDIIKWSFIL